MQSMVTIQVHLQHVRDISDPAVLLKRISTLLEGNIIRLPTTNHPSQEIELWAVTLLTGVEAL